MCVKLFSADLNLVPCGVIIAQRVRGDILVVLLMIVMNYIF